MDFLGGLFQEIAFLFQHKKGCVLSFPELVLRCLVFLALYFLKSFCNYIGRRMVLTIRGRFPMKHMHGTLGSNFEAVSQIYDVLHNIFDARHQYLTLDVNFFDPIHQIMTLEIRMFIFFCKMLTVEIKN